MGTGRVCFLNGNLVPEAEARVQALDRGFLYGEGLFETVRVYGGTPFRLARHWERLLGSCRFLDLPEPPWDPARVIRELLAANRLRDGVVRFTWSQGVLPRGPRPGPGSAPVLVAHLRPVPEDLEARQARGVGGLRMPWPLRCRGNPLHRHKTLSYLSSVLALGRVPPGEEPLLETAEGLVAEGATSNVFWVRGDALHTPHPEVGCLPGVARGLVLEEARRIGLRVKEGAFPAGELLDADEAFLTNAVVEVVPLVRVDGRAVGDGSPGPWTRRLQAAYRARVAAERGRP